MLTAQAVKSLFDKCLDPNGAEVEGIMTKVHLNTIGHENEISEMLADLPDEFQASGGGGWTFLDACNRRDGEQWTGFHMTMDQLFMLGISAGKAQWLFPREVWSSLPGGMPYVSVN